MLKTMSKNPLHIIILAAGNGTRMRSALPKVMHKIAHKPMIMHVIDTARSLKPEKIICVVGPDMPELKELISPVEAVIQEKRLGTGHAVLQAIQGRNLKGTIMVLYGDTPLITKEMLQDLLERHQAADAPGVTVLGMTPPDPSGYGRLIVEQGSDTLSKIIEHKDASEKQRAISFCNSGLYCLDAQKLEDWLKAIGNKNTQGEYYLTDVAEIAAHDGRKAVTVEGDFEDLLGVNTRAQLAEVEMVYQTRRRAEFLDKGVTMQDPATVYFAADTDIEEDVVIEPNVVFGPEVTIESGCEIKSFTHIEGAYICKNSKIGPFARIRPGSSIAQNVEVGNFVEVNRSTIGAGTKAKHFTYLGDSFVHKDVNIGAGTIVCNYDGVNKNKTVIKDGAFIGSNATLIAPLTIEEGAYIAAGSTVTENVAKDSLYVARSKGALRSGWASTHRAKKKSKK